MRVFLVGLTVLFGFLAVRALAVNWTILQPYRIIRTLHHYYYQSFGYCLWWVNRLLFPILLHDAVPNYVIKTMSDLYICLLKTIRLDRCSECKHVRFQLVSWYKATKYYDREWGFIEITWFGEHTIRFEFIYRNMPPNAAAQFWISTYHSTVHGVCHAEYYRF